jgi:CheY-like chemotaxis protein
MIRALEAARASRRRAEEAAGAKSRFLAVMSHEMRTPLNGIVGYAQLLDQRDDIPDVARRQILTMRDSADVLLALISDVLDYSRAEAGHGEIHTAPFAIGQMLERAADMVRPMLEGRDITVEVKSALASDLVVQGDERRLLQVLLNLLGNAAKFTEQGMISLSARPIEPGLIRIAVRDTGIGIAADKLDFVFQPFSQVDSGATRNFEGAGLGLSITKSLVERMGGRIGVESHEARGSEFWLDLPLPCAEPKRPSRMEDDPSGRAVVAKVLVVDDHPVNREVATLMLASAGLEVEAVEDGASAVAAVRSGDFDLVFMDIHMPGMDGLQACREIRALPAEQARVPVIAMTAAALPEDVERCLAAGMNDHISKPIRLEEMLDKAFRQLTPA